MLNDVIEDVQLRFVVTLIVYEIMHFVNIIQSIKEDFEDIC